VALPGEAAYLSTFDMRMRFHGFKGILLRNIVLTIVLPTLVFCMFSVIRSVPLPISDQQTGISAIIGLITLVFSITMLLCYVLYILPAAAFFPFFFEMNFKLPFPEPRNIYGWICIPITYLFISLVWACFAARKQRRLSSQTKAPADIATEARLKVDSEPKNNSKTHDKE